jgi:hypothetical protein
MPPSMAAGVPPVFVPQDDDISNEATVAIAMPAEEKHEPTVIIDKPSAPPMMARKTELDSYKVEVRRPGKRN